MLPLPPTRSIFRSRWMALLWCAGICLIALEVAGGHGKQEAKPGATARDGGDDQADAKAVADAIHALNAQ